MSQASPFDPPLWSIAHTSFSEDKHTRDPKHLYYKSAKEFQKERNNHFYFFRANQWKANIKIYSCSHYKIRVNGGDW